MRSLRTARLRVKIGNDEVMDSIIDTAAIGLCMVHVSNTYPSCVKAILEVGDLYTLFLNNGAWGEAGSY